MTPFSSEPEDTLPRPSESSVEPRESKAQSDDEAADLEQVDEPQTEEPERDVIQPQPRPQPRRRPDRRLDADPGDPEGTHVCAPTDA